MDGVLREEDEYPSATFQQWLDRAQRHVQAGEHDRATECFIQAHWLAGSSRYRLARLASLLEQTARPVQAEALSRILRALEGGATPPRTGTYPCPLVNSWPVETELSREWHLRLCRGAQSEDLYTEMVRGRRLSVAELGSVAEQLEGQLVLLQRTVRRMVRVGPEDAYAWGMLGWSLCLLERRKDAKGAFARATWFASANPNARLRVAECLRRAGYERQTSEQAFLAYRLDRYAVGLRQSCPTAI